MTGFDDHEHARHDDAGASTGPAPSHHDSEPPAENSHPHAWYDDDFCSGGGRYVGKGQAQVPCPVCGEMMDVDEEGNLFKHRPRIPKETR